MLSGYRASWYSKKVSADGQLDPGKGFPGKPALVQIPLLTCRMSVLARAGPKGVLGGGTYLPRVRDLQAQTKGFSRREHKYATLYSDSQALAGDALNKMIDQFSDVNAQNPFLLEKAFTGRPHMWKRYLSHILPSFRVFGKRKEALRSVAVCNKPSSAHCVRSRMPMSICSRRCSLRCIACAQSLRFLLLCSQMPDLPCRLIRLGFIHPF